MFAWKIIPLKISPCASRRSRRDGQKFDEGEAEVSGVSDFFVKSLTEASSELRAISGSASTRHGKALYRGESEQSTHATGGSGRCHQGLGCAAEVASKSCHASLAVAWPDSCGLPVWRRRRTSREDSRRRGFLRPPQCAPTLRPRRRVLGAEQHQRDAVPRAVLLRGRDDRHRAHVARVEAELAD